MQPSNPSAEHNCIPDEHYVQTLLTQKGLEGEITRRSLTHTSWDHKASKDPKKKGWHPATYKLGDANPSLIQSIKLEVETRIVDDLDLSDESPLDESQRLEKIDEHYVECAGTTQQSTYGVRNYGSLMSSHQRDIERARKEGRAQGHAEGRAEIQNKLGEVLVRQNETDEQVRFLIQ